MYDSRHIANHILSHATKYEMNDVTMLKLLKLVYLCHCWHLAILNRPLISDKIEAWKHGPVIPRLYHAVRKFKRNVITETLPVNLIDNKGISNDSLDVIDKVLNHYRQFTAWQLSALTHAKDTPWHQAWHQSGKETIISNQMLQHHYQQKMKV
ncbi:MAG: DUF4065 domain-containing protein [Alphaproteobacteria bacterium]|nr:DUF4065 domain-containing protein [Alphaproteobacteria bacterium]